LLISPSSQSPGAGTIGLLVAAVPSGPNWTSKPTTPFKKKMAIGWVNNNGEMPVENSKRNFALPISSYPLNTRRFRLHALQFSLLLIRREEGEVKLSL
jgi:hypothetical protein